MILLKKVMIVAFLLMQMCLVRTQDLNKNTKKDTINELIRIVYLFKSVLHDLSRTLNEKELFAVKMYFKKLLFQKSIISQQHFKLFDNFFLI